MTKEEFIAVTEQFKYGSDAASLGITINGKNVMVTNDAGDGEGTVYITDKSHIDLPSPDITDTVLTIGNHNGTEDITVGLRRFDIVTWLEPVMILKGKCFYIARVKKSHDFIIRVNGLKITRKPVSNRVGTILDDDPYIDISEDKGGTNGNS